MFDGVYPCFFDVLYRHEHHFFRSPIIRELTLGLGVFPDSPVQVFDGVGGVDDLPEFEWVFKIVGEVVPVFFP